MLKDIQAKSQLLALKKLNSKELLKTKNLTYGYYRKEPYEWVAFDNREGNLLISHWQQLGDALSWLRSKKFSVMVPVYCWVENW